MNFHTGNSGASDLTLKGGKVGIGIAAPSVQLEISGSADQQIRIDSTSNRAQLQFDGTKTSDAEFAEISFANNGDSVAGIQAMREGANDAARLAFLTQVASGAVAEKMTITSTGKVGIGIDAPSVKLHCHEASGTSYQYITSGDNQCVIHMGAKFGTAAVKWGTILLDNDGNLKLLSGGSASSPGLRIDYLGRPFFPSAYSYTTSASANTYVADGGQLFRSTSSERYKNTIQDATHGLTELLTLRPVTYKGNNDGDIVFGGLIAEEVHDAGLTEFVQYNKDNEPDALAYANMVSLCIKSIQELSAKVEALENA
jgi:hypothetical protein